MEFNLIRRRQGPIPADYYYYARLKTLNDDVLPHPLHPVRGRGFIRIRLNTRDSDAGLMRNRPQSSFTGNVNRTGVNT